MEILLDSTKMFQLTDSSAGHLFREIAQINNSEALTVERFGYLYPTARLASLERILSDQRFINAHNYHVHYDGHKEVPAKLIRFEWKNIQFKIYTIANKLQGQCF